MRGAVNIPIKHSKRVYNSEKKMKVCYASLLDRNMVTGTRSLSSIAEYNCYSRLPRRRTTLTSSSLSRRSSLTRSRTSLSAAQTDAHTPWMLSCSWTRLATQTLQVK